MKRLLYFLSKTDRGVAGYCTPATRDIQATLGFFVLLTGVVAFISGTYAISNMFVRENKITGEPYMADGGWCYAALLGFIYATFIMAIDREIVSATNKLAILLRLPLAVIVSVIVSTPIEMQLFDAKLVKQLGTDGKQDNRVLADRLTKNADDLQARFDTLENRRLAAMRARDFWSAAMEKEINGVNEPGQTRQRGKGSAFRQDSLNLDIQNVQIRGFEHEQTEVKPELAKAKADQDTVFARKKVAQSYDLLSKYIALGKVMTNDKSGSADKMGWGITILFFLFETIPCFIKLLLPRTEYDGLLEKRRLLNILAVNMIYEDAVSDYYSKTTAELTEDNPQRVTQMFASQSN